MKYILLTLLLICATHCTVKTLGFTPPMIDCYLCDDYKTKCFFGKEERILGNNGTHDFVSEYGEMNSTMVSIPCKGQKSEVVKCPGSCYINYDNCGGKKRHYA